MRVKLLQVFSTERRFLKLVKYHEVKNESVSGKVKLLFSADLIIDKHQSLFLFEALVNLQHG